MNLRGEQQIEELKKRNAENCEEISRLGGENSKLQTENSKLKAQLDESSQIDQSAVEDEFKRKLQQMRTELVEKTKKANKMEKLYENVAEALTTNDTKVQALKQEKAELTKALKASRDECRKLNRQADKMKRDGEKEGKKTRLAAQAASDGKLVEDLRMKIHIAEEEAKTERIAKERLEKEVREDAEFYNREVKCRKEEVEEYRKVMITINQHYEGEFEKKNGEIKYWNGKWVEQLNECESAKSREKEANEQIAELESKLEDTKDNSLAMDAKNKLISELEAKLEELEERARENDDSNLGAVLEEKENLIEQLKTQVIEANEKVELCNEKSKLHRLRMNTVMTKYDKKEEELKTEIENYKSRVGPLEEQVKKLQAENQQLRDVTSRYSEENMRNFLKNSWQMYTNFVDDGLTKMYRPNQDVQTISQQSSSTSNSHANHLVNGSAKPSIQQVSDPITTSDVRSILSDSPPSNRSKEILPTVRSILNDSSSPFSHGSDEVFPSSPRDDDSLMLVEPSEPG